MAATINVHTGFIPLSFFLYACHPRIEVDGNVTHAKWGDHALEVPPGEHTVSIYFAYLMMPRCGENSVRVNVPDGGAVNIRYSAPMIMVMKGNISAS
jgi:hypothetical protein